jgi:LuxR family transcriptional regulator, maltose regulon positive regulatory protein
MHVGMSEILRERNELQAANEHLQKSRDLGVAAALLENRHRWSIAMAGVKQAQGEFEAALNLLREADRLYSGSFSPNVRPISALRARIWLAQGRLTEAFDWVRAEGLSVDDKVSYLKEFQHLTLARVLIAQAVQDGSSGPIRDAEPLLERLLEAAEAGGRTGAVIEVTMLMAIAKWAEDDVSGSLTHLERALTLAEPEGYVRLFVDEGQPMLDLLRRARTAGIGGDFTGQLMAAFAEPANVEAPKVTGAVQGITEPITAREIEILRLIAAGMRNQEIADHLVISTATVKRHIANAYGKLGASHRTDALLRANSLNLL